MTKQFKVFAATNVLTATEMNDYLMEQAVVHCQSGDRPTGQFGMLLAEDDTDRVLWHDGTNFIKAFEPPQAWTPTVTGLTVGSGTWSAGYQRSWGFLDYWGKFTLGAGSAVAALTLTLPVAQKETTNAGHYCAYVDTGTAYNLGIARTGSTTTIALEVVDASVTYARATPVSSTIPFTWTTTDVLMIWGRYPLTTLYS